MPKGTPRSGVRGGEGWERLPEGWSFTEVAGVAVDSHDRVYVFCRGEHPLIVFDKDGKFLDAWGEGMFPRPHGIFIDHADRVHLVDCGDHTIRTFTTDGTLLGTMGEPGRCSDTGFVPDVSPVRYAGEPFNQVTNVAVLRDGSMYVADGYGNARVHRFDSKGRAGILVGRARERARAVQPPARHRGRLAGTVYVADRENSRIQLFSPEGEFRASWDFVNRPDDIFIDDQDNVHVAELGFRSGVQAGPHFRLMTSPPHGHDPIRAGRNLRSGWRGAVPDRRGRGGAAGNFIAPHGLWGRFPGRPLRWRGHRLVGCDGPARAVHRAVLPEVHSFGVVARYAGTCEGGGEGSGRYAFAPRLSGLGCLRACGRRPLFSGERRHRPIRNQLRRRIG